ncbi:hypothetical protein [Tissierella sp.]|uniref:hypothetical protein n=1 Tax=Tissierella sp. TaxID=41274 RepID=UPI00305A5E4C
MSQDYNKPWEGPESKNNDNVMTIGEWIGILIILAVPILNILMYVLWAFSSGTNKNLQNFCRATLIIAAITIAFGMLIGGCSYI